MGPLLIAQVCPVVLSSHHSFFACWLCASHSSGGQALKGYLWPLVRLEAADEYWPLLGLPALHTTLPQGQALMRGDFALMSLGAAVE